MLNPIKVFEGSFGGETLWENPNYITPNAVSTFEKKWFDQFFHYIFELF